LWRKLFPILCKCVLGHVRRLCTIYINGIKSKYLGFNERPALGSDKGLAVIVAKINISCKGVASNNPKLLH